MSTLFIVVATALVTWLLLHNLIYSHKSQIERLWKKVFKFAVERGKLEREGDSVAFFEIINAYNKAADRAGRLINALLDYHYTDEEDDEEREYVHENRYEEKNNTRGGKK